MTKYLYQNLTNELYFPYLKYKILSTKDLSIYQTVEEGIENRKGKAVLYIKDKNGCAISNAKIKFEQCSHDFKFGAKPPSSPTDVE